MAENYQESIDTIQAILDTNCSDSPAELKETLDAIATWHSRLSYLLPLAKKELRAKKCSEIGETILKIAKEGHLSAKVQNALLDSICQDEQFIVDSLERLQSSCVHKLDAYRSILSYQKQDLYVSQNMTH